MCINQTVTGVEHQGEGNGRRLLRLRRRIICCALC